MEFNRLLSSAISAYGEPNLDNIKNNFKPKENQKAINKKEYFLITNPEEIDSWIKEAEKDGAKLLAGGQKISETSYDKTILLNPSDSSTISKNEVFGPVVCIYAYNDLDKTIEKANSTDVSFQASIFSNEIKEVLNFYDKINASAVFHNDHTAFRVDWMPFAGLKHSGYGVGGIKYTMEDMQIDKMLILKK